MNITLKTLLALGAAGLSLLTLAGGAQAQTQTPAAGFTNDFLTVNPGKTPAQGTGPTSLGIGFDATNPFLADNGATTSATAQSVYGAFMFTSSAAGAFTTISAGQQAQVKLFGTNENANIDATGAPLNFNAYATLYAYNPAAAAGTVPITGADLFGSPQQVTLGMTGGGYYSGTFATTGAIVAGQSYVLGITTLTGDTQDFAAVSREVASQSGLTTANQTFAKANTFVTDNNDQGTPTVGSTATANSVLAFALLTSATSPAPEPSQWAAMAFTGLGIAFLAVKRRRSLAN